MQKKFWVVILLQYLFSMSVFSQEIIYRVKKGTVYENGDCEKFEMENTEIISLKKYDSEGYFYIKPVNYTFNKFEVTIRDDKRRYFDGSIELSDSVKFVKSNEEANVYIPYYYLNALKNKDKQIIFQNQPDWNYFKNTYQTLEGEKFYDTFSPESLSLGNLFVYFTMHNFYLIESVEYEDGVYKIKLYRSPFDSVGDESKFQYEQPYPSSYMSYKDENEITLLLEFDGDYLDIWINKKDIHMGKYFLMTESTAQEIQKLVKTNDCNLANVYFPRHSNGTSDYDNKVISPHVYVEKYGSIKNGNKKEVTSQTLKATSSTNVTPNKTMTVKENLKLRSGEDTSTQVLAVMSAGTKAKILELGKAETIDGISSNWVKVEVQKGAKDRDGKSIKTGTVGWCYGGYLK